MSLFISVNSCSQDLLCFETDDVYHRLGPKCLVNVLKKNILPFLFAIWLLHGQLWAIVTVTVFLMLV